MHVKTTSKASLILIIPGRNSVETVSFCFLLRRLFRGPLMGFSPFSHFNWLLELPLGVAVTIESESGLIRVLSLINGFPLTHEAAATDRILPILT